MEKGTSGFFMRGQTPESVPRFALFCARFVPTEFPSLVLGDSLTTASASDSFASRNTSRRRPPCTIAQGGFAMIIFDCPHCGASIKVQESLAGRKGKCAHCSQQILVPVLVPAAGAGDATWPPAEAEGPLPPPLPEAVPLDVEELASRVESVPDAPNLEECPDCRNLISTRAVACPNCGCPVRPAIVQEQTVYAEIVPRRYFW
jgi:predicted Zn finger-like uncharacterized protein